MHTDEAALRFRGSRAKLNFPENVQLRTLEVNHPGTEAVGSTPGNSNKNISSTVVPLPAITHAPSISQSMSLYDQMFTGSFHQPQPSSSSYNSSCSCFPSSASSASISTSPPPPTAAQFLPVPAPPATPRLRPPSSSSRSDV